LNSIPEVYVITENNPKGIKNFKRNIDRLNLTKLKTRKKKKIIFSKHTGENLCVLKNILK
jgi:hypothetical protein